MVSSAELAIIISARDTAAKALRDAAKNMSGLDKAAREAGKGLDSLGTKAQAVGRTLTLASLPLIGIGIAATKMAMDAVESENLFEVSMGEMAGAARQFSEELRNQFGLNAYEVRKNVGTLNAMVGAMGVGKAASFDMAKGLTQLSYDMASFYNLKPDEAFGKLQAAISGESEPLKRLGIVINETTIKQWALNQGLIKQGQEMSEAQKVVARYGAIMEATSKAQGDLGRTMDSPSNQLRIFKARLEETAIEAGQVFLPVLSGALSWLNEKGLPAVRKAVDDFKASWGEMSDDAKKRILVTAGLFLAGGPLLSAIGTGIKSVALLAKAFQLLPASANIGIVAGVAIFVAFKDQIADIVSSVGMTIRNLGVSLEPLGGRFYDLGLKMRYAGRDVWIMGKQLKNVKNVPAAIGNALLDMASTPAFDLLMGQFDKLGLSVSDSAATVDRYEGAFAMNMKRVAGATNNAIDPLSLWKQAAVNAADGADKLKKEAEKAGISVGDLSAALIATHPATLAAASAVASINLAISANRDQLKAAQAEYNALSASLRAAEGALQDMQNKLGELNKQLSDARQRFADLGNVNLKGTAAATKEIVAIDEQLKRLKLQELLTGETEATKAFRAELEKAREIANLQFDLGIGKQQQTLKEFQENLGKLSQADLEATLKAIGKSMADIGKLTPAEQLKLMEEVAKRANKELTFEEAITQIIKTKGEIDNLTGAIGAQEAAIRSQQAAIDAIRASMEAQQQVIAAIQSAGEALNATLATIEGKQRLVNDALTLAYDWYLRDREKILEMGGAAEDVAATMDEKTTELLEAITQAASDTSGTSAATLAQMVENYKKEMAKALLEVGALKGQLDGIPREITTIHTTIHKDVYENGGAAGNSSNSVLGSYATGTSYVPQTGPYILHRGEAVVPPGRNSGGNIIMNISVQGNVTTERDLAETIRRELLKVKSRNSTVGLT